MSWLLEEILTTLDLAGRALKHLPPERIRPKLNHWPDFTRELAEAYGYSGDPYNLYKKDRVIRVKGASQDEMTALDTFLSWWPYLTREQFQVITARHMGLSWRAIARIRKKRQERPYSPQYSKRIYNEGLVEIYGRLNGSKLGMEAAD